MQYDIATKKHTDTTSRVFIKYTTEKTKGVLLKIEVKNNRQLSSDDISKHPGFFVYSINKICQHKLHASEQRIKARDFYDPGFIAARFKNEFNNSSTQFHQEISSRKRQRIRVWYITLTENTSFQTKLPDYQEHDTAQHPQSSVLSGHRDGRRWIPSSRTGPGN